MPSKIIEKIILGGSEKQLKGNAVTGDREHGFMRGKPFLSKLVYDKITCLVDQGKPVDGIFLDFSKNFNCVSQNSGQYVQHTAG